MGKSVSQEIMTDNDNSNGEGMSSNNVNTDSQVHCDNSVKGTEYEEHKEDVLSGNVTSKSDNIHEQKDMEIEKQDTEGIERVDTIKTTTECTNTSCNKEIEATTSMENLERINKIKQEFFVPQMRQWFNIFLMTVHKEKLMDPEMEAPEIFEVMEELHNKLPSDEQMAEGVELPDIYYKIMEKDNTVNEQTIKEFMPSASTSAGNEDVKNDMPTNVLLPKVENRIEELPSTSTTDVGNTKEGVQEEIDKESANGKEKDEDNEQLCNDLPTTVSRHNYERAGNEKVTEVIPAYVMPIEAAGKETSENEGDNVSNNNVVSCGIITNNSTKQKMDRENNEQNVCMTRKEEVPFSAPNNPKSVAEHSTSMEVDGRKNQMDKDTHPSMNVSVDAFYGGSSEIVHDMTKNNLETFYASARQTLEQEKITTTTKQVLNTGEILSERTDTKFIADKCNNNVQSLDDTLHGAYETPEIVHSPDTDINKGKKAYVNIKIQQEEEHDKYFAQWWKEGGEKKGSVTTTHIPTNEQEENVSDTTEQFLLTSGQQNTSTSTTNGDYESCNEYTTHIKETQEKGNGSKTNEHFVLTTGDAKQYKDTHEKHTILLEVVSTNTQDDIQECINIMQTNDNQPTSGAVNKPNEGEHKEVNEDVANPYMIMYGENVTYTNNLSYVDGAFDATSVISTDNAPASVGSSDCGNGETSTDVSQHNIMYEDNVHVFDDNNNMEPMKGTTPNSKEKEQSVRIKKTVRKRKTKRNYECNWTIVTRRKAAADRYAKNVKN